ncbi:hypothetical protein QOZ80_2BG0179770 [Eleusine coracana subsp. coracana]|nr:hypothetical protein QOZ80_2BG0179770 [Eleusine coracana subsp. coracana]
MSWSWFIEFVNLRFGPPIRSNGLAELKDLYCIGSVEDYQRQFVAYLCHCDDLTEWQQVNLFTARLAQPLRTDVELLAPSNLQTAMSLARSYERRGTTNKMEKPAPSACPAANAAKQAAPATTAKPSAPP